VVASAAAIVFMTGLVPTSVPLLRAAAEPAPERWQPGARHADFDRDGFADLVVSNEDTVRVIYGSASGLRSERNQRWTLADLPSAPADEELGGASTAVGDFDGDRYTDLAVTAVGLHILYGSSTGLSVSRARYLPLLMDSGFPALAVGNFGNGPEADLAVGQSYVDVGKASDAGAVDVVYGSPS